MHRFSTIRAGLEASIFLTRRGIAVRISGILSVRCKLRDTSFLRGSQRMDQTWLGVTVPVTAGSAI